MYVRIYVAAMNLCTKEYSISFLHSMCRRCTWAVGLLWPGEKHFINFSMIFVLLSRTYISGRGISYSLGNRHELSRLPFPFNCASVRQPTNQIATLISKEMLNLHIHLYHSILNALAISIVIILAQCRLLYKINET